MLLGSILQVQLVVGIDLGTQSVKAVVCDAAMRVVGAHGVALATHHPQPGWAEQDPRAWETALELAVAGALAGQDAREVVAIAITGQLDGCVAVDDSCEPVFPALIWQDRRATAHVIDLPLELTGQVADASHMAPKLAWLRERVHAARYHQPVSYLVARLTGAHVLDPAHASTTMLCELATGTWSGEALRAYAIDPGQLPAIAPATTIAGVLRAPLAGIAAGTPVAVGTGDDFATPLGAGLVSPGPLAVTLGTAEVVGALSAAIVLDRPANRSPRDPWRSEPSPMVETHAYPTGAFFIENPGWLSGGAVRWATRLLGLQSDAELDALAAQAPPGADGVTFVPALAGAMTPVWRAEARAALDGLTAAHDRPHVARAVLEGLAFACRDVATRLGSLGLPLPHVLVLGGGTQSALWLQIRADALGLPHHVAARTDTSAIGAAMIAAVAGGLHRDLAVACALAPPPRAVVQPRGSLDEAYERYRGRGG
jgi:xylulokinase